MTGIEEQYIDDAKRRAEKLRECPFCGKIPEQFCLDPFAAGGWYTCQDETHDYTCYGETEEAARKKWNTRADDKLMDEMAKYIELVAHRYSHPPIDNEVAAEARSVLTRIRERRT
jgi:hypothetical protein